MLVCSATIHKTINFLVSPPSEASCQNNYATLRDIDMSMCCPTPVSMCCPTPESMCCPTCVPWSIYHLATSARPPSPSNRSQSSVRRTQGRGNLLARAHVVTSFTKRWQGHPLTWSREVIQPEKGAKSHSGLWRPPTTTKCVTSTGSRALLPSLPASTAS